MSIGEGLGRCVYSGRFGEMCLQWEVAVAVLYKRYTQFCSLVMASSQSSKLAENIVNIRIMTTSQLRQISLAP